MKLTRSLIGKDTNAIAGLEANSPKGSPGANAKIVKIIILIASNVSTAINKRLIKYIVIYKSSFVNYYVQSSLLQLLS